MVHDYVPHVLSDDNLVDDLIEGRLTIPLDRLRLLLNPNMTPVEFSVAAVRFGHTQVRRAYRLEDGRTLGPVGSRIVAGAFGPIPGSPARTGG